MRNDKLKAIFSFLLRAGLSVLLLWYLFKKIDFSKVVETVKGADPVCILGAFVIFLLINFILFLRWTLYLKAFKLRIPLKVLIRFYGIGLFGNLFLPSAIGGDVIKTIGLCRYSPDRARVVASVLLDRLSGFAGMVVVAVISITAGYRWIADGSLLIFVGLMAGASLAIGAVLFNKRIYEFCCRIFSCLPKIKDKLMRLQHDIALLKGDRSVFYKAIGISCGVQVLSAVLWFFIGRALHQPIALIYLIIFLPLICVASSVPSLGGLGVREAGAAFLLAKVGVSSATAVGISLMTFVFMVVAGLLGGLHFLLSASTARDID